MEMKRVFDFGQYCTTVGWEFENSDFSWTSFIDSLLVCICLACRAVPHYSEGNRTVFCHYFDFYCVFSTIRYDKEKSPVHFIRYSSNGTIEWSGICDFSVFFTSNGIEDNKHFLGRKLPFDGVNLAFSRNL